MIYTKDMDHFPNSEPRYSRPTLAELNVLHREFWSARAKKTELQLEDEYLTNEAYIETLEQSKLPVSCQQSFDSLLDRTETRRERALTWLRQENGRRGGKSRKSDKLQKLIEQIVAKSPGIDHTMLLRMLRDKQGLGVIVDVDEEEIYFVNDTDREKSAKISGLKDRLCRARRTLESQKAVRASQH